MSMTAEEIEALFATDEEGRFLRLTLPADALGPELSLVGRRQLELSLDEIVRVKKYAQALWEEALGRELPGAAGPGRKG